MRNRKINCYGLKGFSGYMNEDDVKIGTKKRQSHIISMGNSPL